MSAKRILFIHQNFPGQFPHIADGAMAAGYKVAAIAGPTGKKRPGVDVRQWKIGRGSTPGIYDPATRAEADLLRAEAAARVALQLKADGFIPDLIIGHPGWGETIHMHEVFPNVPMILLGEFFYRSRGGDVGFDPEFETRTFESDLRTSAKNAGMALAYARADIIVCPTPYQAWTFPKGLQHSIRILHEGVDISNVSKRPDSRLRMPNGATLDSKTPVITFINRNFEPLRGFHVFMRALPGFMAACPDAHVIAIGADEGGYGGKLPNGETWKGKMLAEVGDRIDQSRLHFTGRVPHNQMIAALSMSWGHVYYTYPFVLSWSLVEAMACECLIIGSDTRPLRDAVTPGENGILLDFFDIPALSQAMIEACAHPERFVEMRRAARATALERFDRVTVGVPGWMKLIEETIGPA